MTPLEVLKGGYHLLDDRDKWTTDFSSVDRYGEYLVPDHPKAVAWCALGGMYKATGASILTDAPVEYTKAVICVARELVPGIEISDWQEAATVVAEQNDDGGYDKIREAFRSAIAKLTPKKEKQETRELAGVA